MALLFQVQTGTESVHLGWRTSHGRETSSPSGRLREESLSRKHGSWSLYLLCTILLVLLCPRAVVTPLKQYLSRFPSKQVTPLRLSSLLHLIRTDNCGHLTSTARSMATQSDSLMTAALPSDEAELSIYRSLSSPPRCHLNSAAVLELVKGSLRPLHSIQRGIFHYHKTSTCSFIFYYSENFV